LFFLQLLSLKNCYYYFVHIVGLRALLINFNTYRTVRMEKKIPNCFLRKKIPQQSSHNRPATTITIIINKIIKEKDEEEEEHENNNKIK